MTKQHADHKITDGCRTGCGFRARQPGGSTWQCLSCGQTWNSPDGGTLLLKPQQDPNDYVNKAPKGRL